MYNEGIKLRYIKGKENTTAVAPGYLKRVFTNLEKFELQNGKDLSNFTTYEIEDMLKTLNYATVESLIVLNSHLSLYTQWCLEENLVPDCQNHYAEINSDKMFGWVNAAAIKNTIIDKKTLYSWVDQLLNPSDAFIMLALFEGIKGKDFCEIVNLKMSDFNENEVTLCTGRKVIVSNKLLALAEESNITDYYIGVTNEGNKRVPFLNEDIIIKNYPNVDKGATDFVKGRRIYRRVIRNLEFLGADPNMRPNSLFESGKIDYVLDKCKKLNITSEEFFKDKNLIEEFEKKFDYDRAVYMASKFQKKYKEYLK